ncbi:MAG: XRE family transcriptional regulator [Oscillibacter sp.]|nr:XRE family transcriptional regulator [Oscillibacter sp.]
MMQLAEAKVNDAVKLAFLSDEESDEIDKLDLTTLAEFKRGSNGVVEIKFADRMKTIERLMELYREDPAQQLLRQLAGEPEG